MSTPQPPPDAHRPKWAAIRLDVSAGGKAWRKAAERFHVAQKAMIRFNPRLDPLGNVTDLSAYRRGRDAEDSTLARHSAAMRAAIADLMKIQAPTPRELAQKIVLAAWAEGLNDPRAYTGWENIEGKGVESLLGCLFIEAAILDQFHDTRRFGKRGAR